MSSTRISIPHSRRENSHGAEPHRSRSTVRVQQRQQSLQTPSELVPAVPPASPDLPTPQQQQLQQTLRQIEKLAEQLVAVQAEREQELIETRQLAIELAVTIASTVLEREFAKDELPRTDIVAAAIAACQSAQDLTVFLNPADIDLVEISNSNVCIRPDSTIHRGDCRLEYDDRIVERNWRGRLQQIHADLLQEVRSAGPES